MSAGRTTPQPGPEIADLRANHNGARRPVDYPPRAAQADAVCKTRANGDNERWQQQVERRDALVLAAAQVGRQQGEREGYTMGWHWGLACGICAGGMAVGLLWVLWPRLQAAMAMLGVA